MSTDADVDAATRDATLIDLARQRTPITVAMERGPDARATLIGWWTEKQRARVEFSNGARRSIPLSRIALPTAAEADGT